MNKKIFENITRKYLEQVIKLLKNMDFEVLNCNITVGEMGKDHSEVFIGYTLNVTVKKGKFSVPQKISKTFFSLDEMMNFVKSLG